jgi:DNA replication and repair protein RecF
VQLRSLRTVQWRNLDAGRFDFSPGVNVLIGGKGQGKTNVLEAVQYLALGRSHRGARDDEIVRFGADHFFVQGDGEGDAGESFSIEAGFTPPRSKKLKVDGRSVARLTDLTGTLACVSFGPEDTELARGAPEHRRRYVDYALAETSRPSLEVLADYKRALQQRGALLRSNASEATIEHGLTVWDDEIIRLGSKVIRRRAEALVDLGPRVRELYATLTGGLQLHMRYAVQAIGESLDTDSELAGLLSDAASDAVAMTFRQRLQGRRTAERLRKQNLVGPHRDDIEMQLSGQDLRRFGSQGQCRAAAVALKMAQAEFILARRNDRPIVVLDDVFAEFDEDRARALWEMVCQQYQTFLAVPRKSDLAFGEGDAMFEVHAGLVERTK